MATGIRITLDRLMEEREVTLTELAGRVGLTLANLSILKNNRARAIRFSTLEALCRELGCQPGDLLAYGEPSQRRAVSKPGPVESPARLEEPSPPPERPSNQGLPGDYY